MTTEYHDTTTRDDKVYVCVTALFKADGTILPLSFEWEDGNSYKIDKVLDIRRSSSLRSGGSGFRYTIRVRNRDTYMFREEDSGVSRWFMQRK
jgi:hypothetical protein